MNLNTLKYVIAVYEEKNMTKASQKLFVAQPSLSQSIRALEDDLGAKLFDRSRTPLQFTAAGEVFVFWAQHILASEQQMRSVVSDISSNRQRKLTIGLTPQRSKRIIPSVLQKFYAATTGCSIVLIERVSKELELLFKRGCIDLLIDQPHLDEPNYESIIIANETILLAAPESYAFTKIKSSETKPVKYPSISISELADKPFILLTGNDYIEGIFSDLFKHIGTLPSIVLECLSPHVALSMVSLNTGVTLIPEDNIKNITLPNIRCYTLKEYPLSRIAAITYRKDRPLTEDAAILISILKVQFSVTAGTGITEKSRVPGKGKTL